MDNFINRFSVFKLLETYSFKLGSYIYNRYNPNDNNEDVEYAYQYFIYAVLSQILWILSGLLLSLMINTTSQYILCCVAFICARRLSGGMHLDSHCSCYFTTVGFTVLSSVFAKYTIDIYYVMFTIATSSVIYISYCVPKKSRNTFEYTREEELGFAKRYCKNNLLFFIINVFLLSLIEEYNLEIYKIISTSISCGIVLSSLMLTDVFERLLKYIWKQK